MSSIFGSLMNAFDVMSRMDQMRMMEQSTRLTQQRQTVQAQASTVQATVAVKSDGFEVVKHAPLTIGDSQPVELESKSSLKGFRRNEAVDAAAAAVKALQQK